jgi:hypothetical protein
MSQSRGCEQRLRELIDADLRADELERLVRVDALLREVAARDREEARDLLSRARFDAGARRMGAHAPKRAGGPRAKCQFGHRPASVDAHCGAGDTHSSHIAMSRRGRDCDRMREHVEHCPSCRTFEAGAERLATAIRAASSKPPQRPLAVSSRKTIAMPSHDRRTSEEGVRPSLRPVTTPQAATGSRSHRTDEQTHELKLTFGELALVYKSLQAVKTLGALPPQDELLNDTIQLVDQALDRAI